MPPRRRNQRRKVRVTSDVDRFYTREKKRREISPPLHSDRDLQLVISGIFSDDSTKELLNFLSVEDSPNIDEVVQLGVVPRLVEFLKRDAYPQLQLEAIRVFKNIATENAQAVIDSGVVPVFVKLLESSSDNLQT